MCNPAVMGAFAVASTFMQYQAAQQQAKAQTQLYNMNKAAAIKSMQADQTALGLQAQQSADAASQQINDRRLEALRQSSTATVAAGEAGVSGFSVERVLRDISGASSKDVSTIQQNLDWNNQQIQSQMVGVSNDTQSRINSVQKGVKPSLLGTIFKAGVSGGEAYASAGGTFFGKSLKSS
ncbi:TPA: hypothetical protein N2A14_002578 [Pseudomonas aeruginosa]|nr:hypothetical protein [Pseudomonas aeruginosa]